MVTTCLRLRRGYVAEVKVWCEDAGLARRDVLEADVWQGWTLVTMACDDTLLPGSLHVFLSKKGEERAWGPTEK